MEGKSDRRADTALKADGTSEGVWGSRPLPSSTKVNMDKDNHSWEEEYYKLLDAIKKHHEARGHDRCWENDAELYRAAGLEPLKKPDSGEDDVS